MFLIRNNYDFYKQHKQSFLLFSGGIVIQQYIDFCVCQAASHQRFIFMVATIATLSIIAQSAVEIWTLWNLQTNLSYEDSRHGVYLTQALEVFAASISQFGVQFYFLRLAYTVLNLYQPWLILTAAVCSTVFLAGLGTTVSFIRLFYRDNLQNPFELSYKDYPIVFYFTWLSSSFVCDLMTSVALYLTLRRLKSSTSHRSLKAILKRVTNLTIQTFALNSLATVVEIVLIILPQVLTNLTPIEKLTIQIFAYVVGAFLSKLYLFSFLYNFRTTNFNRVSENSDSCVASLKINHSQDSNHMTQKKSRIVGLKEESQIKIICNVQVSIDSA
ncbi:expressed protein [Phakopsora pachyrhizi]|uniref:Expressed protein n=1 Tax=Phakopsora pachyrhizi TaxID=170000 RepID=A0AAV0B8X7_PHAPC|nr:expressed protein [Phakopsora pachyrhizi]